MLPVLPAVGTSSPLTIFDLIGGIICLTAISIEYISDEQLRNFKKSNPEKGANMDQGLWSISRHPNYLGEILFWFGLFILSLSAGFRETYWTGTGFIIMVILFNFISIPMMEKRLSITKKGYGSYKNRVPALLPFLRRNRGNS
jgi:steroid 5-alpha reductase family enzyme